jgi:phage baseplate assembly protein W
MWGEVKQVRCNVLRIAERQGTLTEAAGAELLALIQEWDALEAAYLQPAQSACARSVRRWESRIANWKNCFVNSRTGSSTVNDTVGESTLQY